LAPVVGTALVCGPEGLFIVQHLDGVDAGGAAGGVEGGGEADGEGDGGSCQGRISPQA